MPDQPSKPPASGKPKKTPYSPGVLMVFGLGLLIVAAWCGYDLATKEEWQKEGMTGTILFNWVGMVAFGLVAVYLFVLAAKRAKGGAAGTTAVPDDKAREEAQEPAERTPTEGESP